MTGRYELNTDKIIQVVTRTSAGSYILSRNGNNAHYVGRSDSDVGGRLKTWAAGNNSYTHFWFEYADSPKAAFELECRWWHKYKPADNRMHPDRPDGSGWECPVCDIFDEE